jgi:predicted transcriptional regulator YdeE
MGSLLASLFAQPVSGTTPKIVVLSQPIKVAAMSVDTDTRRIYRDASRLGKRYRRFKQEHQIPHLKEPWAFAAVSRDYDERSGAFAYSLGDVVTDFEGLAPELIPLEIPPAKYAIFAVRPKNRFGWGIAIGNTKRYAYGTWLPDSEYEQGGIIDDFEYHDERSTRAKAPEIDLYICIKDRAVLHSAAG